MNASQFHAEIASKEFMDDLKNIVIEGSPDKVKSKVLELIQCWASAFEKYPQYKIVCDTHNFMKMYGFEFPAMKEADAMFRADSAPEWADGDSCFRCRVEFGVFTRKHHCRSCGQIFCDRCSNRQILLPQFGIEKKVRVCESCFSKTAKEPSPKTGDSVSALSELSFGLAKWLFCLGLSGDESGETRPACAEECAAFPDAASVWPAAAAPGSAFA